MVQNGPLQGLPIDDFDDHMYTRHLILEGISSFGSGIGVFTPTAHSISHRLLIRLRHERGLLDNQILLQFQLIPPRFMWFELSTLKRIKTNSWRLVRPYV